MSDMTIRTAEGVTVFRMDDDGSGSMKASMTFQPTIDRLIEVQKRMEDEALKVAVIQYLRNEGYTVIEPDGPDR